MVEVMISITKIKTQSKFFKVALHNLKKYLLPTNKYMLKVSNRNTTKRCEIIYSKPPIKTPEQCP